MNIFLRSYQELAIAQLDDHFRRGNRRIVLWCQTGSGKTTMAAWMIKRSLDYQFPVMFVVRGRELVKNASDVLDRYGIDHSINMAGHWRYNKNKLVQICSIDTLKSRDNYPFLEQECLIFLDEAHKDYRQIFDKYLNAYVVGMTATPFGDMSKYDSYVLPIEASDLRDQGFLVPERIFCPHLIDTSNIRKVAGDFDKKQLEDLVNNNKIVGDIVEDWRRFGDNRPTVCFAVSVKHSMSLKQAFCDAGIPAVHCDASSTDKERKQAKEDLEKGRIKVICNVDIFSIGWDAPIVSCIILARPTWSLIWFLQAIGRGLRPFQGKEDCIILDNSGNVFRHGPPYRSRTISLEPPAKRKSKPLDNRVCSCEECYFIFDPDEFPACPECGWVKPQKPREIKIVNGKLTEYFETEQERDKKLFIMMKNDYYKMEWVRKNKGLKSDWTFINLQKKYPTVFHLLDKLTVVPDRYRVNQQVLPYLSFPSQP